MMTGDMDIGRKGMDMGYLGGMRGEEHKYWSLWMYDESASMDRLMDEDLSVDEKRSAGGSRCRRGGLPSLGDV